MKKTLGILGLGVLLLGVFQVPARGYTSVTYTLTTDILEILDKDIQGEFQYVLGRGSTFAVRLGTYRNLEDSDSVYAMKKRHWELGARWRKFLVAPAPQLLFFGLGFDNRPQDSTVTPTGELGVGFNFSPLAASAIVFGGYEMHWNDWDANRWVKGLELRVGFSF